MGEVVRFPEAVWRPRQPGNVISFADRTPLDPIDLRYLRAEVAARNLSPEGELILALIATLDERTPSGRRPKGAVRDRVMCRLIGSLRERPATVEPAMDVVFFNLPRGSYSPATADEGSSTP